MDNAKDGRSKLRTLLNFLRTLFGKKPSPPPVDPYAYVMAPIRRGPRDRSGAAVAELLIDESEDE